MTDVDETSGILDDSMLDVYRGFWYYNRGLDHTDASEHEARIECFQNAERCYLIAASSGNVTAHTCLGYIYRYDRCEGRYLEDGHDRGGTEWGDYFPREKRAFECFSYAAMHGDAEACYELGDLYRLGIGCEPSAKKAFDSYHKAFSLTQDNYEEITAPYIWGSIAMRLGICYEEGVGCKQSFEEALRFYEMAERGLEIEVRSGEMLYNKNLARVRASIKRIKQELSGEY